MHLISHSLARSSILLWPTSAELLRLSSHSSPIRMAGCNHWTLIATIGNMSLTGTITCMLRVCSSSAIDAPEHTADSRTLREKAQNAQKRWSRALCNGDAKCSSAKEAAQQHTECFGFSQTNLAEALGEEEEASAGEAARPVGSLLYQQLPHCPCCHSEGWDCLPV